MAFILNHLGKIYNIPNLKTQSYFIIKQTKPSILNQCRPYSTFKYPKHVTIAATTIKPRLPSLSSSSSSILSSTHLNNQPWILANKNMMLLQRQQLPIRRTFTWWRIPLLILSTSGKKRKMILSGLIGSTALLGFFLGPLSFLIIGGIAGLITIRLWRQTKSWWRYLPTVNNVLLQNPSFYAMLRSQVGQHRAEDHVRALTIQKIKKWAHTDQGKNIFLNEFNVDHVDDLIFLPNHATATFTSSPTVGNHQQQQVDTTKKLISIQFWVESEEREDCGGIGGCMVTAEANADPNNGDITFKQIKLSSPSWTIDEFVPLDDNDLGNKGRENVIEGEFKNV